TTIVGVMPAGFVSPTFTAEIWSPLAFKQFLSDPMRARQARLFRGIGRLRPNVSADAARSDAAMVAARVNAEQPGVQPVLPARFVPLRDAMLGGVRPILLAVMGAALLVLLITCTNIAGLFLARGTARRREIAV